MTGPTRDKARCLVPPGSAPTRVWLDETGIVLLVARAPAHLLDSPALYELTRSASRCVTLPPERVRSARDA